MRVEIVGSPTCRIVGKSQSVFMMIHPIIIFTRTRISTRPPARGPSSRVTQRPAAPARPEGSQSVNQSAGQPAGQHSPASRLGRLGHRLRHEPAADLPTVHDVYIMIRTAAVAEIPLRFYPFHLRFFFS
eukprot:COSAG01_NODE_4948_length_4597_cov_3.418853_8_plen_129_part_00